MVINMRYAIIQENKVANIAIAEQPLAENWVEISSLVEIGDVYQNNNFIKYDPKTDPVAINLKAESIRLERTQKLFETDWTQVADVPVDQVAWAAYRQALRDITAQDNFPWNVVWPTQPE